MGGTNRQSSTASNINRDRGLTASPSIASHNSRASDVSRDSYVSRPAMSPLVVARPDSPSLGDQRMTSGVSNVSESDRGHLRGISETSVSTQGEYATPMALSSIPPRQTERTDGPRGVVSPLTPPLGLEASGDYMTHGSSGGRRKSNFNEELDK